ncbi:MAG: PIG-L deacetylase family protein [Myxococcota bacterium]
MLIPIPDLLRARRVLCVQPHYDDNDIGAGGTLARLAGAGAEIHYLTVTDDVVGVLDRTLSDAEARRRLAAEQERAGREVGVRAQARLDYPDAGEWSAFALRREVVRQLRSVRPDFVLTVDPWLPYEAHQDHVRTGLAVAEACLLFGLPRFASGDASLDAGFEVFRLRGIAFYFSAGPNTFVDIGATRAQKHRALDAYASQFTPEGFAQLHGALELKERAWAKGRGFEYGEAFKVLAPGHLHVNLDADEML